MNDIFFNMLQLEFLFFNIFSTLSTPFLFESSLVASPSVPFPSSLPLHFRDVSNNDLSGTIPVAVNFGSFPA
ncbi:unnamed protein product [Lathyrus sativus]|nr:unnamed protein product [Lathyrus sativus]